MVREREHKIASGQTLDDPRFFTVRTNPTVNQLDEYAKLILLEMVDNKPIKLVGFVPMWTPPKGVEIVQQQGTKSPEFVMVARKESALDALLGR
jgi:hypothetical protein